MAQLSYLWQQFLILMNSLVGSLSVRNVLDVSVVAMAVYYIIKLVRQTRANTVFKGLAVVLVLMWISDILELNATNWIIRQLVNTGVIIIVVLFQPEFRRGLEQIGRSNISGNVFIGDHKPLSGEHDVSELRDAYYSISSAVVRKRERKVSPETISRIVLRRTTSIASKIYAILRGLARRTRVTLISLIGRDNVRGDAVAAFFAALQLARAGRVHLENDGTALAVTMTKPSRQKLKHKIR